MTRHPLIALCFCLIAFLCVAAGAPAQAQQLKTVNANESAVLDRAARGQLAEPKATIGTARIVDLGTAPDAAQALIYIAPDRPQPAPDAVTYTKGGMPVAWSITVSNALPYGFTPETYDVSFKAIFLLFVLAVLLESGLTLLFHWKPYFVFFDSRTTNALVAFAVALLFVHSFQLDIVAGLLNAVSNAKNPVSWGGEILTALIVAGGSSGVNRLLRSLGFRPFDVQEPAPKPKPTEAWISVSLVRKKAAGPVDVVISEQGTLAVAGSISGTGNATSFRRLFLRSQGRFPPSGGHSVKPNVPYEVFLQGTDKDGNPLTSPKWGPHALASGALIDIELPL